jgi:hypothetical protein
MLAETDADLPPILVNRATLRVIDGMHRLQAAAMKGQETIQVEFFEGAEQEAFLLAVKTNIAHGLPLTLADRRAAAARIIRSDTRLSDRSVAAATGLAARTVATIRCRVTGGGSPASDERVGRDGRVRRLDVSEGRRVAAGVITAKPTASLHEIAREAGVSVGTAHDVRKRIRAGQDPVPASKWAAAGIPPAPAEIDPRSILDGLRRDPALRYTDSGRSFLRWLGSRTVTRDECRGVVDGLSPHCAFLVSRMARECAAAWSEFADELERRNTGCG